MTILNRKPQSASCRIVTPKQIVESLLSGQHEMQEFPDLFHGIPAKAKHVIQELIDIARPLQLRVRALECQIEHVKKCRKGEIDENISLC